MDILIVPAMAALNRFSGYDNISWLPGRNIYWAAVATFAIGFVLTGNIIFASMVFASMLIYRLPGWFGLRMEIPDVKTFIGWTLRTAIFAVPLIWLFDDKVYGALLGLGAGVATSIIYAISWRPPVTTTMKDPGWISETLTGAVIGAYYYMAMPVAQSV